MPSSVSVTCELGKHLMKSAPTAPRHSHVPCLQVGAIFIKGANTIPGDFNCYRRAEAIPVAPDCAASGRATLFADDTNGASESAAEAAAALAAASALLQGHNRTLSLAKDALATSFALYDYAERYETTAASWSAQVNATYPVASSTGHRLWGAAMLAWVHVCADGTFPSCDAAVSQRFYDKATNLWAEVVVRLGCSR